MQNESETRMTVRMPQDLYEWLKENAKDNFRSLNAQVVAILEEHRKQIESDGG